MKILSIATFLPYPPDHGTRTRTWNLLRRLAAKHEVTLVTWVRPSDKPESVEVCRKHFHEVIVLTGAGGKPSIATRAWIRALSTMKRTPPYTELMTKQRQAVPELSRRFDIAVAEDDAAILFMPAVACPTLVHRHNVFSDTLEGLRDSGALGALRKLKWTIELPAWRRFDKDLCARADVSIVTTEHARQRLGARVPMTRIEVVPNGADPLLAAVGPPRGHKAVFVGTMSYEPNADAAVRFCRDVWPRVRQQVPDAEFHIIGRDPMAAVREISQPGVVVTGSVDDVAIACEGALVGICPLYSGSGIKNKTLEMMGLGLPVVATSLGSEGIAATPDQGLIEVDDDALMAEHIIRLLLDPARSADLGIAARDYLAANFSWEQATAIYERVIDDIVSPEQP
ncbi:MAG: glycosyltransferase family 4 protein [Actinomycetota bacterium]